MNQANIRIYEQNDFEVVNNNGFYNYTTELYNSEVF